MSGEGHGQIGSGDIVTAALLVIGDEILSGRTKDKNIGHIADHLTAIGIQMKEVRVVADEEPEIVDALNALRKRYNYVFTTGGIGPTHDDITADAVAKTFGVGIDVDERALAAAGANGVMHVPGPAVHVIVGPHAAEYAEAMQSGADMADG